MHAIKLTGRLVLASCGGGSALLAANADQPISYNERIQPLLAENCFHCHGPDAASRKGHLRLDAAAFSTRPRDDGERDPAIVPGKPAESMVIERIKSGDPEEMMPPPDTKKHLKPDEIALLEEWIGQGAKYETHWSLIPPVRPKTPDSGRGWARNPIDAFVADRLEKEGLRPAGEEHAARLLRRLTFDLTGLPPEPAEVEAFVRDPYPAAYQSAVDRLLASDSCAEHFARLWLDAVRYADTHGIHKDNYRSIWPYRDWVVNAYRRNLPFDQFTLEQMAGDLLPGATLDQRVATGYNRCLSTTNEGGAIVEEYEAIYAKDRVDTLGAVWLGLTTGCAACHDHKFDPFTTRDFYSLTAFFRNNAMPVLDGNRHDTPPSLFVPALEDRAAWERVAKHLGMCNRELADRKAVAAKNFEAWLAGAQQLTAPPTDYSVVHRLALGAGPSPESRSQISGDTEVGPYGPAVRIDAGPLRAGPAVVMRGEVGVSVALFVKIEAKVDGPLLSCRDAVGTGTGWEVFLKEGKIGVQACDATGRVKALNVGNELKAGEWHHLMVVLDAAPWRFRTVEVFVDGVSAAGSGLASDEPLEITPSAPLVLGGTSGTQEGNPHTLVGGRAWAQDLRIYRRGLPESEIKELAGEAEAFRALKTAASERTEAQRKALSDHFFGAEDAESLAVIGRRDVLRREEAEIRTRGAVTLVMEEKKGSQPFAHVLTRGDYSMKGEKIGAETPSCLPPMPADLQRNRLGLAHWLTAPDQPLTARVTMNRLWQQFFGTGIVDSTGDFGVAGSRPSHPQLLDWLAVEFRESGWDYRRMARLMVTSATYRQSAVISPILLERDPSNRLLARGPRYRLDAEQLRDQALAASGLLVAKLGGRPVRPYQPDGIWEDVAMKDSTTRFYRTDGGDSLYRRSLYTLWKRTAPAPAMDLLNAPSREVACVRRDRTNTPLQALVTLNDPLFVEAARNLATRTLTAARGFQPRLDQVTLRLLGRRLDPSESDLVRRTWKSALGSYQRDPAAAAPLLHVGRSALPTSLDSGEVYAWTVVASQVMNLDESLTK